MRRCLAQMRTCQRRLSCVSCSREMDWLRSPPRLFHFLLLTLRPPRSPLFPYTTLFRSAQLPTVTGRDSLASGSQSEIHFWLRFRFQYAVIAISPSMQSVRFLSLSQVISLGQKVLVLLLLRRRQCGESIEIRNRHRTSV